MELLSIAPEPSHLEGPPMPESCYGRDFFFALRRGA
jgi:hypothetical protein